MSDSTSDSGPNRREFLKRSLAAATAATAATTGAAAPAEAQPHGTSTVQPAPPHSPPAGHLPVAFPRVFRDRALSQISFPLGGVAAGSIGLGGRGQLRDWEIFNRPDRGNAPSYAFPAIRVEQDHVPPFVSVLESRIQPPYQGNFGLGARSAPGLQRLEGATFTGEYPLAHVAFHDSHLPVSVTLDAFSPFVPHEEDDSGLPIALLRYTVRNPGPKAATVSIAYSIENPMSGAAVPRGQRDPRVNEVRRGEKIVGVLMRNPTLSPEHAMNGSLALAVLDPDPQAVSLLSGWPRARWWTSALHFWDDFSADGVLGPEPADAGVVAAVCIKRVIRPGETAQFPFLISWHFPNRTPDRCGWIAPEGLGATVIGNYYCTRFADAWAAAEYAAASLPALEQKTRQFADTLRDSTIPAALKEAASANLSTLATQTTFRTADGEFHGFEGCGDQSGCCEGNCTHVWNYETTTSHLFPRLARSLRRAAFGYSMDDDGGMRFRQMLPDGVSRFATAAADGQMGQIMKVYLDWQLSGDQALLDEFWPKVKRAIGFAWHTGGWDANRDGVLEGAQHNTYDIEFYGPNPLCGIYYLGALRAVEEMSHAVGDDTMATESRRLFESGRDWIDANLFNGEYYVQQVRGEPRDAILPSLLNTMGSDNTDVPEYQLGNGCLVDQLVGQYQAEVCGLGPLVASDHCLKTLRSILRYNYKHALYEHDTVQRTFALNDEAALVIADYGRGTRPDVPFPYYAEVMTGFEYTAASHMIYAGLVAEGIECVGNIRARYDGERRNPWDEAECGSHYARAMAAWSAVLAISGFRYDGPQRTITALPRTNVPNFRCFWSTGTGWGRFTYGADGTTFALEVLHGTLPCRALQVADARPASASPVVTVDHVAVAHTTARPSAGRRLVTLGNDVVLATGQRLAIS